MLKLSDPSLLEPRAYIDGEFLALPATFEVKNPSNGKVIAHVSDCDEALARQAINAAFVAQKDWAKMPAKTRAQILRKLFDLLMGNQDDLTARVGALKVGDGFENGTQIGPLITDAAMRKVEVHIEDAVMHGAKIETGGHALIGTFFEPTVISNVTKEMQLNREETFDPLAPVMRFKDEADVVALANDSEFGLAGCFYSKDMARCFRVGEALEVGMVGINTGLISNEATPFGGIKQSGLGREGSKYGLDDYTEIKYLCFGEVSA